MPDLAVAPAVALVLAGGMGSRMGRPKQFIELLGVPALLHTLRAFERTQEIDRIYTVGDRACIEDLAREAGISKYAGCAPPGESRPLSTKSGLLMCREDPDTIVLIHDGSRCLVTPDLIDRVIQAARGKTVALPYNASNGSPNGIPDGVVAAIPVSDTIKVARNGTILDTLDRTKLQAAQTPQAFRLGLLQKVYAASEESLLSATDDASLVEKAGGRVQVVAGEKTNIKLTSPEDLVLAEAILAARKGARYGVRS
ncbi:MAG: 2-C-methyl-D-erythritol 4-phosphate cytidylyltransferase [Actinomycetota bacterium]|jgi:2-C-methyl-D-erythritol 4-phosphate cytidylyltransferase|nr:2-C-methyl-D-erythritol 4-phosphate cytidylyltransferase [Actinomycetota bacterium]